MEEEDPDQPGKTRGARQNRKDLFWRQAGRGQSEEDASARRGTRRERYLEQAVEVLGNPKNAIKSSMTK